MSQYNNLIMCVTLFGQSKFNNLFFYMNLIDKYLCPMTQEGSCVQNAVIVKIHCEVILAEM